MDKEDGEAYMAAVSELVRGFLREDTKAKRSLPLLTAASSEGWLTEGEDDVAFEGLIEEEDEAAIMGR